MQVQVIFLFVAIVIVCVFSFLSIAVWVEGRRKEREAYYKSETTRRITELPTDNAQQAILLLREEERIQQQKAHAKEQKTREGMKIGGLINIAIGIGFGIFLYGIDHNESAYLLGFLPVLIGVALLVYVYLLQPKPIQ